MEKRPNIGWRVKMELAGRGSMIGLQGTVRTLLFWSQQEATMPWTRTVIIDIGNKFMR